jgi:5-hydroxyisourate hydrolase
MGRITTHVLDTARGRPGAGIKVELFRIDDAAARLIASATTNADGRTDGPMLEGAEFRPATYELAFHMGAYFQGQGFLDVVPVRFRIVDATAHYHVPLLCTPWSYSTYRGS